MFIKHSVFIAVFAILYSALEIEIEGKNGGWAKNLPTVPSHLGELTVYHVIMNIIIILVVIYSTMMISNMNLWITIYFVIAWFLIEDFAWFVLNPFFTLKKYTKKDIWWHGRQKWILGMPMHNWVGLSAMAIMGIINKNWKIIYSVFAMGGVLGLTVFIAPFYHEWYKSIRKNEKNNLN